MASGFAGPAIDFSSLQNLGSIPQRLRDREMRNMFAGGLPMKDGVIDFDAAAKVIAPYDPSSAISLAQKGAEYKGSQDASRASANLARSFYGGGERQPTATSGGSDVIPGYNASRAEVENYIREAARQRGIDPEEALRVYRSEGASHWQSQFKKGGKQERSYGPFQLYMDGGVGNEMLQKTGVDPSDPNNWKQGIDFALDTAKQRGWGPWYGAKRVGITGMPTPISNAQQPPGMAPPMQGAQPQPAGPGQQYVEAATAILSNPNASAQDRELAMKVLEESAPKRPDMDDVSSLRKEIHQIPSYKNLAQAAPVYTAMLEASKRNDRVSDIDLIYGLGKILDPGSVVREGELNLAMDTSRLPTWLVDAYSRVSGGGRLTGEVRQGMLHAASSRIQSYQGQFEQDKRQYEGIVQRHGMNQADVIPNIGGFQPYQPPPAPSVEMAVSPPIQAGMAGPETGQLPQGVTEEDIQFTMQLHGLTREQVLQRISQ